MRWTKAVSVIFFGLLVVTYASAAPMTIDFSGLGIAGGTVNYAGGNNPLVGSNLNIVTVVGNGTPLNASPAFFNTTGACTGGLFACLNFQTGNEVSQVGTLYTFGSGGFLTITGNGPGGSTGTLLNAPVISGTANMLTGDVSLTVLDGADTKNDALLAFFGVPSTTQWAFSGTVHSTLSTGGASCATPGTCGGAGQGNAFTSAATGSTDIDNLAVPDPASISLFGTVLFFTAALLRRRRQA